MQPYGLDGYGVGLYGGTGRATARVYDRLPEAYRDADTDADYPLLRYLSLTLDQLEAVDDLVDRIDYDRDADDPDDVYAQGTYGDGTYGEANTSDLVDATTANARWLPWLAQLLGVRLDGLTLDEQRAALTAPETSWDHGTPSALAEAAKRGLTGTRTVVVTPHYGGNPYVIGIGTRDDETLVLDTFGELMAARPTWGHLDALGSFANATASGPVVAADVERPAGYQLVRYPL